MFRSMIEFRKKSLIALKRVSYHETSNTFTCAVDKTSEHWHAIACLGMEQGGHLPPGAAFWDAELGSEFYVIFTKCQMSPDDNNSDLWNVEWQRLQPSCKISSRSPKLAKRPAENLRDISRWNFCLQQSAPANGLTHGCLTMLWDGKGCELSDLALLQGWEMVPNLANVGKSHCFPKNARFWQCFYC